MDFLRIPQRTSGNREYGVTSIADFGMSLKEIEHILSDFSQFIDIAKLGIGSAYVTPNLEDKIQLYKSYGIEPYCGGTLFEKAYYQGKMTEYKLYLEKLGIRWIEISTGTLDIPLEERIRLVEECKADFDVLAEVGSKDTSSEMSSSEWIREISELLKAGSRYVITEGRDSGTAGIYENSGSVKSELIQGLLTEIDERKIIFEASLPKHQMYFINEVGPNVNLGNVRLSDVLTLEAQRCGLRSETFYLEEKECKLPL